MKKHIKLVILGIIVILGGCKSAIEIEQPGRLGSEQAFETVTDLESGVLGVYNFFDNTPAIQFNSVFTDQVKIGNDNGGQGLGGDYGFVLNPESNMPRAMWTNYYEAINAASRVIEVAPSVVIEDDEQDDYNNALGEALALRAWAHFELLTYFSPDYTDDNALGVILVNFVPTIDQLLPRNTNGEVFTSIDADLAQAKGLLLNQASATFISLDFVKALQARMAAYRGQYALADQLAAELLADYPLADRAEYVDMFLDNGNGEVIFKLERTIGDSYDRQGSTGTAAAGGWAGANFAFVNGTIDGSPYFEMSNSLFNLLNPGDVRYDVNVNNTSDIGNNILVIGKYPGSEGQPLMNDLKIFRASEMMLIRAEAAAEAGNLANAAGFIDQLTDARFGIDGTAPTYASQQEAFTDILNERRMELAYEGHRWVDLKRLGQKAGIPGIIRDPADCEVNGACALPIDDYRFTGPIPLVELDANPNIQQNQSY